MSSIYVCTKGNEQCFCQECDYDDDSEEDYEDDECNCSCCTCTDIEDIQRRKDVFKKISDFFQLPLLYSNMNITYFYNTNSILDYKYVENNKPTDQEISDILNKYINEMVYEKDMVIKKIKIMIFFQIIILPNIRKYITSNNNFFDIISNKFKEFSEDREKSFASFIEQFNFCV